MIDFVVSKLLSFLNVLNAINAKNNADVICDLRNFAVKLLSKSK